MYKSYIPYLQHILDECLYQLLYCVGRSKEHHPYTHRADTKYYRNI